MDQTIQNNLKNLWDRAWMLTKREDYQQVKHVLEKIIKIDKKSWVAYWMLSNTFYQLEEYDKALYYIGKTKELPGLDAVDIGETEKLAREIVVEGLRSQVIETLESDEIQETIEKCLSLLEINPLDEHAIGVVAGCYFSLQDWESVIRHLDPFLANSDSIVDPSYHHLRLFSAKKELDRLDEAKIHHDYLLANASEQALPMLRFELAEYAFRQQQFTKAWRLIEEFERFLIVSELPIEEKDESEIKIWSAKVGILRALDNESSARQMETEYLEEIHDGSRDSDYSRLITILAFAEKRRDSKLIREILDAGWLMRDDAEQIIPVSKYFEGLIYEWRGETNKTLVCFREFKNRINKACDQNGSDFNEAWEILCKKPIDYAHFALPTDKPEIGSYVDSKIQSLSVANSAS